MISISIQCEESEIPALRGLLRSWGECHPTEKVDPVRAPPAGPGAQTQHSEKAHMSRENKAKKLETDTKPPLGSYPQNFYEAPIDPLPPVPPEHGKNKYGRWDTPVSEEIDAEIARLHKDGKSTHEISAMLSERDINITWQRVRGRIAYMGRKAHNSSLAEGKPNPLHMRILDLDRQKMTPHTISDILEEEMGAVVSEAEIMDIIVRHAKGDL